MSKIVNAAKRGSPRWDSTTDANGDVFDLDRLGVQAESTGAIDRQVLEPVLKTLHRRFPKTRLTVLDVGSGPGFVAHERFSGKPMVDVTGIEFNLRFVKYANLRFASQRMRFEHADARFYAPAGPVHLVVMMQFLQHVGMPGRILRHYWNMLAPGGFLVARNSDDQLNITYPSTKGLDWLVAETNRLPKSPDRHLGRKLYGIFSALKPAARAVQVFLLPQLVAGGDAAQRQAFFDEMHGFRELYAKKAAERAPSRGSGRKLARFEKVSAAERRRFANEPNLLAAEVQFLLSAEKARGR